MGVIPNEGMGGMGEWGEWEYGGNGGNGSMGGMGIWEYGEAKGENGKGGGYSSKARSPSNDSPLFFANKSSKSCTPIFARASPPTSSTVRP